MTMFHQCQSCGRRAESVKGCCEVGVKLCDACYMNGKGLHASHPVTSAAKHQATVDKMRET